MTNSADLASCESADIQRRILELIEDASSIAISGHTSPDGDALGSVLGLGLSLMKFFLNKDIALLLADDDPVPRIYRFMEGSDRLERRAPPSRSSRLASPRPPFVSPTVASTRTTTEKHRPGRSPGRCFRVRIIRRRRRPGPPCPPE